MDEEQGWVPAAYLESDDGDTDEFVNQPVTSEGETKKTLNSICHSVPHRGIAQSHSREFLFTLYP